MKEDACILAIESSCDDTSAAVYRGAVLLSHVVSSQGMHAITGGVIPEVASRAHQESILPVVDKAMQDSGLIMSDLDAIAYTKGPGLLGALIVGVSFAKTLALSLDIPCIAVHHMQAHILSNFIEEPRPVFPFLNMTVSGGHTELVIVQDHLQMQRIGRTLDDAAGEAFDKIGKMMGLAYPAGPEMDRIAQGGHAIYEFPEPDIADLDFSFSGLKTSVMRFLKQQLDQDASFIEDNLEDLCASVQERICTILLRKAEMAMSLHGLKHIALAGGVSANSRLRSLLEQRALDQGWTYYYPRLSYCTDNAAMIGITAHYKYLRGELAEITDTPDPRLAW